MSRTRYIRPPVVRRILWFRVKSGAFAAFRRNPCVEPSSHNLIRREDEFMTEILTLPVEPKSVVWNPTPEQLRRFTEEMTNCRKTEFGNVNVATKVVSRSTGATCVAPDTP